MDNVGYCGGCVIREGGNLIGPQYKPVNMSNARLLIYGDKMSFPYIAEWHLLCSGFGAGLSLHVWTEGRVNYLYMLELDPRDALKLLRYSNPQQAHYCHIRDFSPSFQNYVK